MVTITLLSDFGLTDPYVAEMKGVILSANPDLRVVDVSHGIERHDIAMGSFILETALPYFPLGSIHVAVVDPGVGTERLPLVVLCKLGVSVSDEGMTCIVLHVDSFGNVILNLGEEEFLRLGLHEDRRLEVKTMHGRSSASIARTYSKIHGDQLGIILGSQGYVEIAM